eukprot:SAG22_NODE_3731_length_1554_cov_4.191065_2_plen_324_part_00
MGAGRSHRILHCLGLICLVSAGAIDPAAAAAGPAAGESIMITIPGGASPGQMLHVTSPSGQEGDIQVPQGKGPGDTLTVTWPGGHRGDEFNRFSEDAPPREQSSKDTVRQDGGGGGGSDGGGDGGDGGGDGGGGGGGGSPGSAKEAATRLTRLHHQWKARLQQSKAWLAAGRRRLGALVDRGALGGSGGGEFVAASVAVLLCNLFCCVCCDSTSSSVRHKPSHDGGVDESSKHYEPGDGEADISAAGRPTRTFKANRRWQTPAEYEAEGRRATTAALDGLVDSAPFRAWLAANLGRLGVHRRRPSPAEQEQEALWAQEQEEIW